MKKKTTALLLAGFLGGIGAHKFYLGKYGRGILYLLLCGTGLSIILGIIEAVILYRMKPEVFNEKYNEGNDVEQPGLFSSTDKKQLKTITKWGGIIIGGSFAVLMILGVSGVFDYTEEELVAMETERVEQAKIAEEEAQQAEGEEAKKEQEEIVSIKQRLTKEIEGMGSFDTNTIKGDAISLGIVLGTLDTLIDLAIENENHPDTEIVILSNQLQTSISKLQAKVYPIMRRKYSENMDSLLREHNIEVSIKGGYADTLVLVGGRFANNKNIKREYESMREQLLKLRFATVEYRRIPNGAGAEYTLSSPNDSEVIRE